MDGDRALPDNNFVIYDRVVIERCWIISLDTARGVTEDMRGAEVAAIVIVQEGHIRVSVQIYHQATKPLSHQGFVRSEHKLTALYRPAF